MNEEFEQIKLKLGDYLKKISDGLTIIKDGYPTSMIEEINKSLDQNTFDSFFKKGDKALTKNEIDKVLIVNFNYTNLLNIHLSFNKEERTNVNTIYIHGSVKNPKKIIFGYGDDTNPEYTELELTGEDKYLKHIKSFYYPLREDYIQLMNFLENDYFEVQVVGHSLGLSDRVLLKSIFENDNCRCIRILHRGRKEEERLMFNKYTALSRHFDDKSAMRNKVKPFDFNDRLKWFSPNS